MWWAEPTDVALPTPNVGENRGRSYAGNIVSVLSPTMTNEVLVSYSRLTLDNRFKDPSVLEQGAGGVTFNGIFPAGSTSPYLPTDIIHGWGASGQVGTLWAKGNDMYAHNDALQFSDKLTKLLGAHSLKFGIAVERGQKQQNFQNLEAGQLWFGTDNDTGTGNSAADMLVGRVGQFNQGTAEAAIRHLARRSVTSATGTSTPSPRTAGSCARTSRSSTACGSATGRTTGSCNGLGGYFTPSLYDPTKGSFLDPGTYQRLNGVCYVENGCAPAGILENRSPFALPRVNVAWDIDGEGNNVLRGGYGIFYNRNQGNVEYNNTLRLPPNAYQVAIDFWAGGGFGDGLGLNYDTSKEATLASRIGTRRHQLADPDSFTFPKTHSFSLSYARSDPVQPGRRGELCRHARPRPGQPDRTATSCPTASSVRHVQRRRPLRAGEPRRGRQRRHQPRRSVRTTR